MILLVYNALYPHIQEIIFSFITMFILSKRKLYQLNKIIVQINTQWWHSPMKNKHRECLIVLETKLKLTQI